ncbi:MAG: HlyD family type I secretion periplasmic adaptor subunit [Maritimibacter sp.]|nr:HlyD family type I secretion periplasmic adaptor subunit [Maritimibacter sp.]
MVTELAKIQPKQVARPIKRPVLKDEEQAVLRAWTARGPMILGLVAILLLVGGLGTWAVTTTIAGAIVAPGALEVEQNRQAVQHVDGGVVDEIMIREGDVVEAGQVLIRLDRERLTTELTIIENQWFDLMARRGMFEAERDGLAEIAFDPELVAEAGKNPEMAALLESNKRLFAQRAENLAASIEQLEERKLQTASQIEGLEAQRAALRSQLEFLQTELDDQLELEKKALGNRPKILALQREKASLEGSAGELQATVAQAEARISEIQLEILKIQAQLREEAIARLNEQEGTELETAERRRAVIEQLDRLDIRAPLSGAVHELKVFGAKSVIRPADPILYIVPQDRPLVIAVQVEPIHVDEVFVGQEVNLVFAAFDTRRTPEITGRVISVSPDALQDERTGRSYYRARVEISEGEVAKLPEGSILVPGMPVQAQLRTADRSPAAYLLKPFIDYFRTAFREN